MLEEAESLSRRVLAADTASADAYSVLGIVASLRGHRDDALQLFKRALGIRKNHESSLTRLAMIYMFELNEPAKALIYLKQLQELEPTDWLLNCNLGVGYGQMKNYAEAKKCFSASIRLNPSAAMSASGLAYTYERLGENDSAIRYYSQAVRNEPRDPKYYDNLACLLLACGRFSSAESVLEGGLKHLPGDYVLLYDLGLAYALAGNHAKASERFREGLGTVEEKLTKNPKAGDLHVYAGLLCARLGRVKEALAGAETASRVDSTDEDVAMKITRVYAVLGRKEEMLGWFRRTKSMNPEYDLPFLATAMDFERYRKDPDLLAIAGGE
jgi:tetratricopeptide (TPR) repeat protein